MDEKKTETEIKTEIASEKKTDNERILEDLSRLRTEIFYNRIVMAIFLVISLFYFNLKISSVGNALGTFIEMLMP